eukprot:GHUV01008548.1.p1 GENE.GHUV01008548.1~~GHUV01008548.1.p1  ORF type:complete len:346 (+),score=90.54 GHUV01008548.1:62-1099(+)
MLPLSALCRSTGMATFLVQTATAYNQRTQVSKPVQLTCWTKTTSSEGGQYCFGDESGLLPYRPPEQLPVDLNTGFETHYTKKSDSEASPVDHVVQAASAAGVDWSKVDICTYRNNINKVLTTLIGDSDWAIDCCKWGNTVFLDINKSAGNVTYPNQDKLTYYGYKFEAVCTGQDHVDATSEFAVVVQYQLGQHRVLMAAEVDAMKDDGDGPVKGRPYVELKTYKIAAHSKAVGALYKEKHPRWWVQSYLAGISTLVLGGRDHNGQLHKVQEVPVQLLPGLSAQAGQKWDPDALLAFGDAVLGWIIQQAQLQPGRQLLVSYSHVERRIDCRPVDGDLPQRLQQLLQ